MITDTFMFKGDTNKGLGYKYEEVYRLSINENPKFGLGGIVVTSPIFCPYSSWSKFFENWEHV